MERPPSRADRWRRIAQEQPRLRQERRDELAEVRVMVAELAADAAKQQAINDDVHRSTSRLDQLELRYEAVEAQFALLRGKAEAVGTNSPDVLEKLRAVEDSIAGLTRRLEQLTRDKGARQNLLNEEAGETSVQVVPGFRSRIRTSY